MTKRKNSKTQTRTPAGMVSILDLVEELAGSDTAAWQTFETHLKDAKEVIEKLGPLPPAVAKGFLDAHQIHAKHAKCMSMRRDQLAEIVMADAMARIARVKGQEVSAAIANDDCPSPVPTEPDVT